MPKAKSPLNPVREKDGSVSFYLRVNQATPDGTQYKPYSTAFVPNTDVHIKVRVAPEHVLSLENNVLVLSPLGWFTVAKQIATASVIASGGNH